MILFGGDYNPEQWPEKIWARDVELMRAAGVSLVTVGVFSWSRLEPRPGRYDFGWLDRVLDRLDDSGIGVCLATPTASPPPWFSRAHPLDLPVTDSGVRLTHGSRDTYCVHSPAYLQASVRIAGELAARYARHPAVRLWHVHNEYGTACYCERCAAAFRVWLSGRYGDPDALNDAWSTDFWSQRYAEFDEVQPPRATQYLRNPGQLLDYRRFVSDSLLRHFLQQRAVLRAAGAGPVTTNFAIGGWVPVDHARWAREVDFVAIDDYPSSVAGHLAERAFTADMARGWARSAGHDGGRWLLMEHMPGAVNESGVTRALTPGEASAAADTYVSRGAAAVMYFQWRAGPGGAEQWHPDMVSLLDELSPVGQSLASADVPDLSTDTAMIFDEQALWAWDSPHLPTREISYVDVARRWHTALGGLVDVVPPFADISGYALVVVPALYLISPATHSELRNYVEAGGTLVIGFASGLVDDCTRTTPGSLDDLIGARIRRHVPLLPGETLDGIAARWIGLLEPTTARVLLALDDGRPLVVENVFGRGVVRYIAADLTDVSGFLR